MQNRPGLEATLCQKAFSVLVNDIFSKHALSLDIYPFLYVGSDIKEMLYEVRCLKSSEDMILALAGQFNPFPSKRVLRALIDFTLSNARRFYSSMGNLLDRKGLKVIFPE